MTASVGDHVRVLARAGCDESVILEGRIIMVSPDRIVLLTGWGQAALHREAILDLAAVPSP